MPHLNWGVLGSAMIARVCVIPAIQKSRNGTVHAIASRSMERAQELAQQHRIPHVYDSYDALLKNSEIEAVYIPLPNNLHLPWTLRALEAGKHVLCEKPLALDASEAQQMVEAARSADLRLMEALMYRFHPRSRRIKQLVDDGRIGLPRLIRIAFTFNLSDQNNMRYRPEMGGGALMDVGCYGVSLARWLLGAEPVQVQAQAVYSASGVDVNFVGTLRFPEGQLAVIEASLISALQQTYSVVGSVGAIELPHDAFIPWEKEAVFTLRGVEDEAGVVHSVPGADEYQLMVEHFAEAALGNAPLAFEPLDSVKNMRVVDALRQSARK